MGCAHSSVKVGAKVEALVGGRGHPGRVVALNGDGSFQVLLDDGTACEIRTLPRMDGPAGPVLLNSRPDIKAAPKPAQASLLVNEGACQLASRVAKGESLIADADWIAEALDAHNRLRAKHGAPPLKWDPNCAQKAQLAADACAARGALFHSHCKEYGQGQNAFFGTPGHYSTKNAVESWYNEYVSPGYHTPAAPGTGHFTQVVWLATTHVGVACDRMGKGYIVANYSPPGNVQPANPHYLKNVLPVGTPMQTRPTVCTVAKKVVATSVTAEVREILESIPHENIKDTTLKHLRVSGKAELDYCPQPKGSITVKLFLGSGGCQTFSGSW